MDWVQFTAPRSVEEIKKSRQTVEGPFSVMQGFMHEFGEAGVTDFIESTDSYGFAVSQTVLAQVASITRPLTVAAQSLVIVKLFSKMDFCATHLVLI